MAPVIRRLSESTWAKPYVIAVGQHTHLLDLAIKDFGIAMDEHIEIARLRTSMMEVMARAIEGLDIGLEVLNPACVIAQGDTTTVLAAGLVAFHRRIPFVHIEAGLRTGDLNAPFPEEFNRRVVALATSLHCAPTARAMAALVAEGVCAADCIVTGNTVIDALLETAARNPHLPAAFPAGRKTILLTAHRRENFGLPLEEALSALRAVVDLYPDTAIFFPVHPNPNTKSMAERVLGDHPRIVLSEPLSYSPLVAAIQASWLIVTDSGGLQEEGPALGKPVLVLRAITERPEALIRGRQAGRHRRQPYPAGDLGTARRSAGPSEHSPTCVSLRRRACSGAHCRCATREIAAGKRVPTQQGWRGAVRTDTAGPHAGEIHPDNSRF